MTVALVLWLLAGAVMALTVGQHRALFDRIASETQASLPWTPGKHDSACRRLEHPYLYCCFT